MSWLLVLFGFIVLVVLHELGHFTDLYKADEEARELAAGLVRAGAAAR